MKRYGMINDAEGEYIGECNDGMFYRRTEADEVITETSKLLDYYMNDNNDKHLEMINLKARIAELEEVNRINIIVMEEHAVQITELNKQLTQEYEVNKRLQSRTILLPTEEEIVQLVDKSYKMSDHTNMHIEGRIAYKAIKLACNFIRERNGVNDTTTKPEGGKE